jgi:hypothetical protein
MFMHTIARLGISRLRKIANGLDIGSLKGKLGCGLEQNNGFI